MKTNILSYTASKNYVENGTTYRRMQERRMPLEYNGGHIRKEAKRAFRLVLWRLLPQ